MVQLDHAPTQNLEFTYCPDVPASLGEATITENNLLEIRRRRRGVVHLRTL